MKKNHNIKVAVDQLEYASKRPGVVGYVEASEKLMNEMKKMFNGFKYRCKRNLKQSNINNARCYK